MNAQIIGRRVSAWIGPRRGQHGTIVAVDGLTRARVRWDIDGETEPYRRADLIRVESDPREVS